MDTLSRTDLETHTTVVGWLQIVHCSLGIVWGIFSAAVLLGVGAATNEAMVFRIMAVTAAAFGGLMFVLSAPGIVAGIGLLRRARWSRIMALVLAVFELTLFPIGTLLGAYTLFVLSQRAVPEVFGACCAAEEARLRPAGA
jgi:hypothetical protein